MARVKCDEMFDTADQDGDGRLGYDDMAWFVKATNGPEADFPAEAFEGMCAQFDVADMLITKDQLFGMYEMGMGSIEEDWAKLKASQGADAGANTDANTSTPSTNTPSETSMIAGEEPSTLAEAIALFKSELGKAKVMVPSSQYLNPADPAIKSTMSREEALNILAMAYTDEEKAALFAANKSVMERFELVPYVEIVPVEVIPTMSEILANTPDHSMIDSVMQTVEQMVQSQDTFSTDDERKTALSNSPVKKSAEGKYQLDLRFADLTQADLRFINMTGANLYTANLSGAVAHGAIFRGAKLAAAKLFGTDCTGSDCTGADLSGMENQRIAVQMNMIQEQVKMSQMMGHMGDENFDEKEMDDAVEGNAYFKAVGATTEYRPPALFIGATMCKAKIWFFNGEGTIFNFADLTKADFRYCFIHGSQFYHTILRKAKFRGALMHECQLESAEMDQLDLLSSIKETEDASGIGAMCKMLIKELVWGEADSDEEDEDEDGDEDEDEDEDDAGEEEEGGNEDEPGLNPMSMMSSPQEAGDMLMDMGEEAAMKAAEDEAMQQMEQAVDHVADQAGDAANKTAMNAAAAAQPYAQQAQQAQQAASDEAQRMVEQVKSELAAKRRTMASGCQAKMDTLMKGLEAQARYADKMAQRNPASAEAFVSIMSAVAEVGNAQVGGVKDSLLEAEKSLRANAAEAVLRKFIGAELKVPTAYEAKSMLQMARLVCTTNPHRVRTDKVETERLMEKIDEICGHDMIAESWAETFDAWHLLLEFHAKAKGERNRGTLEQIFNDPRAMAVFGQAKQLRHLGHRSEYFEQLQIIGPSVPPPNMLLTGLSEVKIKVKNSIDTYKKAADKEMLRMDKVVHRQEKMVMYVAILVGNFVSLLLSYAIGLQDLLSGDSN